MASTDPVTLTRRFAEQIAVLFGRVRTLEGKVGRSNRRFFERTGPLLGFTDAAIAKGASGTVSIYNGTPGSESDTGVNVTAYNRFANVAISKYVWVQNNGHGWYLTAAECA